MNWKMTFKNIPILLLILSGCNVDRTKRIEHAGPVNTQVEIEKEAPADPAALNRLDITAIENKLKNLNDERSLLEVKNQLEPLVLNSNNLLDPHFIANQRSRSILSFYNLALSSLLKKDDKRFDGDLEKYYRIVRKGCDENLRHCQTIGFFKQDHRSTQILVYLIRKMDMSMGKEPTADTMKKYYEALGLAFELKNSTRDTDLEFLYMKRATDYAKWYQSLSPEKQNLDVFKRHGRVFEMIVNSFPNNPKNKEFQEFVANFGPWRYSRLKADPFPFGTRRMFTFASTSALYEQGSKQISNTLKEAIEESKKEKESFTSLINDIKADKNLPVIFAGLNLDISKVEEDSFYDEYFFMVDRLYKGHWDIQETSEVWQGSNEDSNRFVDVFENYLKITFLHLIIQTNRDVSTILSQPDLNNENLVKQTVARSKISSDRWKVFLSRIEGRVSSFIGANLRNSVSASAAARRAEKVVETLRRNIKFMSVYPNMILLSYFIKEMNASVTVETFFGPYEIKSSEIIDQLFNGQTKVLFDFGNDTYQLNKIELLYAYYFALTTGSFETYAGRPLGEIETKSGQKAEKGYSTVDRKSFFEKVIRQFLSKDKKRFEKLLANYLNFKTTNSFSSLIGNCKSINAGQKDFEIQLDMQKFLHSSTFGPPSASNDQGLIGELYPIYSPDLFALDVISLSATSLTSDFGNAQSFELDRQLETKIAYVQAMVDILARNMEVLNFNQSQIQDIQKTAQNEISSIQTLSDNVYKEMIAQHRVVGSCLNTLINFDRERNTQLLEMEKEHLGRVYDFMLTLKGKSQEEVETLVKEKGPSLGFEQGLDDVNARSYKYNRLNVIRRMAARVAQMSPSVRVNFATNWREDKTATENQSLNLTTTREEFIRNGMSYFGNRSTAYLEWTVNAANIHNLKNKYTTMIELYRYSQVRKIPNGVTAADLINEALEIIKYISIRPKEKELLSYIGGYSRVRMSQLEGLFLKDNREPRSLMDFTMEALGKQKVFFDEAKTIYSTYTSLGSFLFPTDVKLKSQIIDNYRPLIQAHENVVRTFEKAVEVTEISWAQSQVEKQYLYNFMDYPEYFHLSVNGASQKVELISDRVRGNVNGRFDEHHSDTGSLFKLTGEEK